ncbi:hypothetical protein H4Q26_011241 [Puccinia striiformis f. sp. tritici PST-130]|nr:hypothetical protein H4Q26_011241 [Puccinia striiformis f. sp. tritici PST-130]
MFSTIYVACLLISAGAFASPVALEPRGFMQASSHDNTAPNLTLITCPRISGGSVGFGGVGGFNNGVGVGNGFANGGLVGGVGIQSQSYNAANSASTSTNNIGMNGGLRQHERQQLESRRRRWSRNGGVVGSAMNSFQTASQQIQQIQSTIQAGQFNAAMASQQMQSIAASMQSALSTANTCGGACFGPGAGQFGNTASSTISQFSSLINMMRSSFGNQFGGLISPFANLGTGPRNSSHKPSSRNPARFNSPPTPCNNWSSPLFNLSSQASKSPAWFLRVKEMIDLICPIFNLNPVPKHFASHFQSAAYSLVFL